MLPRNMYAVYEFTADVDVNSFDIVYSLLF